MIDRWKMKLTLCDVDFLHPRVHDNGRLVLPLADRLPLHLSGLCTGHPGLALQVNGRVALLPGRGCVSVSAESSSSWVLSARLCILPMLLLHRVWMIAALLWCVWRRRRLHGLIASSITATVLGIVVIPPLVTKITVIFFTWRELRLSIFTAHHVGLHD